MPLEGENTFIALKSLPIKGNYAHNMRVFLTGKDEIIAFRALKFLLYDRLYHL